MVVRGTQALEMWARRVTAGYPGVRLVNMTSAWRDGLAFCAIIHSHRPDLIDFPRLDPRQVESNCRLAFQTAERELGVPALLDPADMAACSSPDRLSVLTYLSELFHKLQPAADASPKTQGSNSLANSPVAKPALRRNSSDSGIEANLSVDSTISSASSSQSEADLRSRSTSPSSSLSSCTSFFSSSVSPSTEAATPSYKRLCRATVRPTSVVSVSSADNLNSISSRVSISFAESSSAEPESLATAQSPKVLEPEIQATGVAALEAANKVTASQDSLSSDMVLTADDQVQKSVTQPAVQSAQQPESEKSTIGNNLTPVLRRDRTTTAASARNRGRMVQSLYISSSQPLASSSTSLSTSSTAISSSTFHSHTSTSSSAIPSSLNPSSTTTPSSSFQSVLSRFQQLADSSCDASWSAGSSRTRGSSESSDLAKINSESAELSLSESKSTHIRLAAKCNSEETDKKSSLLFSASMLPQTSEVGTSTFPEMDCKTIQTEESFLQLYRSKKRTTASRRSETERKSGSLSSSSEAGLFLARRPEAALNVRGTRSTVSEASYLLSRRPESGHTVSEAARPLSLSLSSKSAIRDAEIYQYSELTPRSRRSTIYLTSDHAVEDYLAWDSRTGDELRSNGGHIANSVRQSKTSLVDVDFVTGPVKPVRGQCVTSASLMASNGRQGAAPLASQAPYKRSLSRSSHCLITATALLPVRPDIGHTGRSSDHSSFYIDIYEGQSTLV